MKAIKQLTIGNKEILAVEVPEDAYDFEVYNKKLLYIITQRLSDITETRFPSLKLPPGQWSIIARVKDIGEEQARGLVGASSFANKSWINYEKLGYPYYTALESWQSFCKVNDLKDELIIVKQ